jgi:hypothetical protein
MDTEEDDEIDIVVLRIDVTATAEYDEEETQKDLYTITVKGAWNGYSQRVG